VAVCSIPVYQDMRIYILTHMLSSACRVFGLINVGVDSILATGNRLSHIKLFIPLLLLIEDELKW
jgi:hypothetical protein